MEHYIPLPRMYEILIFVHINIVLFSYVLHYKVIHEIEHVLIFHKYLNYNVA